MLVSYFLIALLVYIINVIPFFMPATWTVLSFIAIRYQIPLIPIILVGATSATLGRLTLAKLSQTVLREKILSEKTRKNIDQIRLHLEKKTVLTFSLILFYTFSPFASNQLFIAYGMTKMDLKLIAIPFFIGRLISYSLFTFGVSKLVQKVLPFSVTAVFTSYFIVIQFLTIILLYLFAKIDWGELLNKHKIKLIK